MLKNLLAILLLGTVICTSAHAQREERRKLQRKESLKESSTYKVVEAEIPLQNYTIEGTLTDGTTGEPLIGATVMVEGTNLGALADDNGKFLLELEQKGSVVLVISLIGYQETKYTVTPATRVFSLQIKEQVYTTEAVVVSGSRMEEKMLHSPVSIQKIDALEIRQSPSLNLYSIPYTTPGVDVISSSIGFQVMNARGFSHTSNPRFMYWVDGMDLMSPGLNISVGMLNGVNDLDVASAEITAGPASAMYGPNAFNGIFVVNTKSPFEFPGLSFTTKVGVNHVDGKDHSPTPLSDSYLRFAHKFNSRWAFKINGSYMRAYDWVANSGKDIQDYTGTINPAPGPGNPGYHATNRYGGVVESIFSDNPTSTPFLLPGAQMAPLAGPLRVARTGYWEHELLDYTMENLKGDLSIHHRLNEKLELIAFGRMAVGSAVYQGDSRFNLQDFTTYQTKLELKGQNFFVRAYSNTQNSGKTYDTQLASIYVESNRKPINNWFSQYVLAYTGDQFINGVLQSAGRPTLAPGSDTDARSFADADNRWMQPYLQQAIYNALEPSMGAAAATQNAAFLSQLYSGGLSRAQPGTPEYDQLLATAKSNRIEHDITTGSQYFDRSAFYHGEAQYRFDQLKKHVELLVGGNYRLYLPHSQGTIFIDTSGNRISSYEYGGYVQAARWFAQERLRLIASLRFDGHKYTKSQLSPRLAMLYVLGKNKHHVVRGTFQTGFRQPSLLNQFIYLDTGEGLEIGGIPGVIQEYGIDNRNNYSSESYSDYLAARAEGQAPEEAAARLKQLSVSSIQPEQVINYEVGYRGQISEKLSLDLVGYYSIYRNLINTRTILAPLAEDLGTANEPLTADDVENGDFRTLNMPYNNEEDLPSVGFTIATTYVASRYISLTANMTSNHMAQEHLDYIQKHFDTGYNTPPYRSSVSIVGKNIRKRWGFGTTWRWVDSYYFQATIGSGVVPAYQAVDLQINYTVPKLHSMFKLGGTNVLNNRHIQVMGGPTIGALYYLQWTYDLNLK